MKKLATIVLSVLGVYCTYEFLWIMNNAKSVMHQNLAMNYLLVAVILFVFAFLVNHLVKSENDVDVFAKVRQAWSTAADKQKQKYEQEKATADKKMKADGTKSLIDELDKARAFTPVETTVIVMIIVGFLIFALLAGQGVYF